MEIGIIGTSIWQQNTALLEHLTLDRETRGETLKQIKQALDLDELIYLSTCNRVELIYATTGKYRDKGMLHRFIDFFFKNQHQVNFFPNDFYHYPRREAVRHLFRTVSSLESLVIGETQISSQFKDAYESAQKFDLVGPNLKRLADAALTLSRRVKRETGLVSGSLSMAALACKELREKLDSQEQPTIALVGAGEMTVKMARYIQECHLGELLFVNRSLDKAQSLAEEFNGRAISLEQFTDQPEEVNAIISATASRMAIFDIDFLEKLLHNNQAVVCIDLAVPRDFSTDFLGRDEITLIDIPYLKARGNGNRRQRFVEAARAGSIVAEAVNDYLADQFEVSLKPIFQNSYKESLELSNRALSDLFAKRVTSLAKEEKEAVIGLVNKLIAHSSFQPARMISDRLVQMDDDIQPEELHQSQRDAVSRCSNW